MQNTQKCLASTLKGNAVVESCYNLPILHGFPWCQGPPTEIGCSCCLTKRGRNTTMGQRDVPTQEPPGQKEMIKHCQLHELLFGYQQETKKCSQMVNWSDWVCAFAQTSFIQFWYKLNFQERWQNALTESPVATLMSIVLYLYPFFHTQTKFLSSSLKTSRKSLSSYSEVNLKFSWLNQDFTEH